MINSKNKMIIIIIAAVIFVVAAGTGTALIIRSTQKTQTTQTPQIQPKTQVSAKEAADTLTLEAVKIINSDPASAKTKLEQARKQYQDIKDANGVANIDSQLYLIAHQSQNKVTTVK